MSNKDNKVFENVIHNYQSLERSIVEQLYFKTEHGPTIGTFREAIWKSLFEQIIPRKFIVEQSVFIVDSQGEVSKEVDLAIIDELYTPYIFRQGHLKFVPIEAVAVAVECKSSTSKDDLLEEWVNSIKRLKTSDCGVARMHTVLVNGPDLNRESTQTATRPLLIYCHLDRANRSAEKYFDITLHAKKEGNITFIINSEVEQLEKMYQQLNHALSSNNIVEGELGKTKFNSFRIGKDKEEVTLLSLNFVLNQILMLINNPMLFPHLAYARLFQEKLEEIEGDK